MRDLLIVLTLTFLCLMGVAASILLTMVFNLSPLILVGGTVLSFSGAYWLAHDIGTHQYHTEKG